jgi:hypothetical protein
MEANASFRVDKMPSANLVGYRMGFPALVRLIPRGLSYV